MKQIPVSSVADPDPLAYEPFGRIRIRSNCPDPDPKIKSHKTYKKYNKLSIYFCNIANKLLMKPNNLNSNKTNST